MSTIYFCEKCGLPAVMMTAGLPYCRRHAQPNGLLLYTTNTSFAPHHLQPADADIRAVLTRMDMALQDEIYDRDTYAEVSKKLAADKDLQKVIAGALADSWEHHLEAYTSDALSWGGGTEADVLFVGLEPEFMEWNHLIGGPHENLRTLQDYSVILVAPLIPPPEVIEVRRVLSEVPTNW